MYECDGFKPLCGQMLKSFRTKAPALYHDTGPSSPGAGGFCSVAWCRNVPYAFWHLPLRDLPPGYPVFLDINLSQEGAQTWLSWLQEGLLLDANTRGMQVTGQGDGPAGTPNCHTAAGRPLPDWANSLQLWQQTLSAVVTAWTAHVNHNQCRTLCCVCRPT